MRKYNCYNVIDDGFINKISDIFLNYIGNFMYIYVYIIINKS